MLQSHHVLPGPYTAGVDSRVRPPLTVIPAKAGIHAMLQSRHIRPSPYQTGVDSRVCHSRPLSPSFPRKRESTPMLQSRISCPACNPAVVDSRFRGNDGWRERRAWWEWLAVWLADAAVMADGLDDGRRGNGRRFE